MPLVIAFSNIYGAVDNVTFKAFIANKLVPKLWKNACVVMDNAKIHFLETIRELIKKAGAKLIYLSLVLQNFRLVKIFGLKSKLP